MNLNSPIFLWFLEASNIIQPSESSFLLYTLFNYTIY